MPSTSTATVLKTSTPRHAPAAMPKPTPPRGSGTHRLLYCGALSLPDSRLQLDGIAFTARLPPTSPSTLLDSPLPLALESMRGRPLSLVGVVSLKDTLLELADEINLFVNPAANLTVGFFERNLCYDEVDAKGLTTVGIRIGLGDEHEPQEDDIIICGRVSAASVAPGVPMLQLVAARIAPKPLPAPPQRRAPRPDDPSPRRPDIFSSLAQTRRGTKRLRDDEIQERAGAGKRTKVALDPKIARAKDLTLRPPPPPRLELNGKSLPAAVDRDGFRVPGAPAAAAAKRKEQSSAPKSSSQKPPPDTDMDTDSSLLETVNKTTIKSVAVKVLSQRGLTKDHPEFKEVYQWTLRGVGFAMRKKMTTTQIDIGLIKRLVEAHTDMYVDGQGGGSLSAT
ncbi:hypothetical protein EXIGLDRAFT_762876 [Exidia glandulosa HHB12029]|uniref:Sld7 C-terminal domain-containing protein n=1 Tax=Exidia glandulosa HHB12029 TaxID=1314781 RepID=A0A165MDI2_EXIGL|nr:hypothetical protein EXIGLDRAFT_762876 [Exidia glandulosa HHB12029]